MQRSFRANNKKNHVNATAGHGQQKFSFLNKKEQSSEFIDHGYEYSQGKMEEFRDMGVFHPISPKPMVIKCAAADYNRITADVTVF